MMCAVAIMGAVWSEIFPQDHKCAFFFSWHAIFQSHITQFCDDNKHIYIKNISCMCKISVILMLTY